MSRSSWSVTSVGTRPSGLYSRIRSKSRPTDQFACSNGISSSFIDIATRRTNGESNIPISSIDAPPSGLEKEIPDQRGDHDRVEDEEYEEALATRLAPLRFELHAQDRFLRDMRVDPRLRFPASESLRDAQGSDRLADL